MTDLIQSRRAFMGSTGLGMGLLGLSGGSAWALGSPTPDLIVFNANVWTVDAAQPTAQAFAVKNGKFIAVGSNDEIKGFAGPTTQKIDAGGATVVPGFIDAHIHASGDMLLYDVVVGNPFEVEFLTIAIIQERLRQRAKETPPGTWITGAFYDDTKVKDGRQLNRHDLDKVSTEHPIRVRHRGGHTYWYNSKAFELAGVTRDTPNPPGGEFFRDKDGELTGRAAERANIVLNKTGKEPVYTPAQEEDRARVAAAHFSKQLVKYGVTSVQSSTHQYDDLVALQAVRASGDLRHRVSFEVAGELLEGMIKNGIKSGFGDEWVRLGATAEYVVDGSFSERTMAMTRPYVGMTPPNYGILVETQDVLDAWAERVHRAGIRLNCHANGDRAIDVTLTAYERALKAFPVADTRPKITHCTMINDDLIKRIKAIGAVPTPFTSYAYYNSDKFGYYGAETMDHSMAFRSFLDAGIPAAAGSDYFPGPFAPLMGIQGIVTRKGWNGEIWGAKQRVTVAEAIQISTLNGAYASHEETIKGSIAPGKLADFVMLAADPQKIDPEQIVNIKVLRTVTGGKTVYEA
jgi:predicted amidohydrolase YtcJ